MTGHVSDVQEGKGVRVFHEGGISGVRIYTIHVTEVLKDSGNHLGSDLSVCILPEFSSSEPRNHARERELFEQYKESKKEPLAVPQHTEFYPMLPVNQARIFLLFPVDFNKPQGDMSWVGIKELAAGRHFYGYETSFPVSESKIEVEIVKHYLQIVAVKDTRERVQQLLKYSMDLIQNRALPLDVAVGTIRGLGGWYTTKEGPQPAWHLLEESLTPGQLNSLIQAAVDPSQPLRVRITIIQLLDPKGLEELANRVIPKEPFIQILRNRAENFEVRQQAMHLLKHLDGSDVRQLFEELALQEPVSQEERYLFNQMRESELLKKPR